MNQRRPNRDRYYLDIARAVATRSTCIRRRYGAVIVSLDQIISTGYNGAPRGVKNCLDLAAVCPREKHSAGQGRNYDDCRSVHAEMNAIIQAGRQAIVAHESVLYLVGVPADGYKLEIDPEPCKHCKRAIINAGIEMVITEKRDGSFEKSIVQDWLTKQEDYFLR